MTPGLVSRPAAGLALPGLFRGTVAVSDDGLGVADELIALLREAGVRAIRSEEADGDVGSTVFLGGLGRLHTGDDDVAVAREAFHAARAVAGRGSFVTVGRAGRAGLGALTRTCAREWPEVTAKSIEVDFEDEVASALAAELLGGGGDADIVLRADGGRAGRVMLPSSPRSESSDGTVGPESVIVFTGGGRGVTAACARALARACRPHIVLIGRTALTDEDSPELRAATTSTQLRAALVGRARRAGGKLSPAAIEAELKRILAVREIRGTLADIAVAGSPVRYLAADVADRDDLSAALREVREQWGPVTGLVHGAGILADRLIVDKTDEQFDRVIRAKVDGLRNALDLIGTDESADGSADGPRLVCVFSSVAASSGNAGQCDYAVANEIVERIAVEWRDSHPGCLVKAIAWGPWHGGMVGPELAAVFRERNIPLIPLAEGADAFVGELASDAEQVRSLIVAGDGLAGQSDGRSDVRLGEIAVNEASRSWLADHRIGGRAVVPLAVACDWMLRPAGETGPVALRDIDVLHGATAPDVVSVSLAGSQLAVTSTEGRTYYRARRTDWIAPGSADFDEPTGLRPFPDDSDVPVYDGETLFHGPRFQVIRRVEGIGPAGATGVVVGAGEMRWPDEPWRTDPAAVDGAIQLAVIWAREVIGRATLPMAVREARFRAAGLEAGLLRCVVRAVSSSEDGAVCDVVLVGADGGHVAELAGLQLVVRPR